MAHDGTGDGWDIAAPANNDPLPAGAQEIRDLRAGVAIRMNKEHSDLSVASGGGEHRAGSAKAYFQNTFPTKRPNGLADLDNTDRGRLLVRSDTLALYFLNNAGTGWEHMRVADGSITQAKLASGVIAAAQVAVIGDVKSNGTPGGTFTSGAWRTRDLNTELSDDWSLVTISANQFTLATGTYEIQAFAPAYSVNAHQARLRKVSGTPATISTGSVERASTNGSVTKSIVMAGTVEGANTYEIQHICQDTIASNGFGTSGSFSVSEVFTLIYIRKIAP